MLERMYLVVERQVSARAFTSTVNSLKWAHVEYVTKFAVMGSRLDGILLEPGYKSCVWTKIGKDTYVALMVREVKDK